MNHPARHSKSSLLTPSRLFRGTIFVAAAILSWHLLPGSESRPPHNLPTDQELQQRVPTFLFQNDDLPVFTEKEKELALLGKKLFFDSRFSANGKVSCATCHTPEKSFSDGKKTGEGLARGTRKTPSLVNVFASSWFFWDGRADSLAAQALGPIEHPGEHGISRTHVARMIRDHYATEFKALFDVWPEHLDKLPDQAMPFSKALTPSSTIAMYTLASLDSFMIQDDLLVLSRKQGKPVKEIITGFTDLRPPTPEPWGQAWERMPGEQQGAINRLFSYFGQALAEYERGLVAVNSPFDRFARRLAESGEVRPSLSSDFGQAELLGLRLFLGPGGCTNCHFGPAFTNQQFHNIGLPMPEKLQEGYLDAGRSVGAVLVKNSPFSCTGPWLTGKKPLSPACEELPWLDTENLENVGAFKTPALRNVAQRAPFGHDGRFPDLESILEHYNELPGKPFIGHREETLKPLEFSRDELAALKSFLESLTSDITDSTTGQKAKSPGL